TPQVYSVAAPLPPTQVANSIQVLSVQQHVVAQDATIAQLVGVPCVPTPDHFCIGGTVTATPDQVIVDLTAQVGSLDTQVAQQTATISQQGQLIVQQQSTITSLVNQDFGLPVTLTDASAARAVAASQIQAAAAVAATPPALVAVD